MATVIERLRELQKRATESESAMKHETDNNMCALYRRNIVAFNKAVDSAFPALLALADAVKAKDQAAIDKALAELEKEAT